MAVIDVHTHMLTEQYLELLSAHSGPKYERKPTRAGQDSLYMHGAPFMTLMPEMWDYDARIRDMDAAGVDLAIVSLTCPNAYFGDESISREPHAFVTYDHEQRKFHVSHGGKANVVRLNDDPVLTSQELSAGDTIRIGATTLSFVAFCGPDFDWAQD